MLEVASIVDSLIFHLTSAFLVGSEHQGATVMLGFQEYKYCNSQYSLPPKLCQLSAVQKYSPTL
jgi:hypothetical protein